MMFGRSEDETMMAIHKQATDKVSEIETCTGVSNINPDRAGIRVSRILGESGQGVFVISEILGKGGAVKDRGYLLHHERDQLASLLVVFGRQPVIGKVADLETGFRGSNFDPEISLGSLLFEFRLEQSGEDFKIILIGDVRSNKGQTTPARLHRRYPNRTLGVTQMTIDLVIDNILHPLER